MKKPIRVIPAILTDNSPALRNMLVQAASYTDYVQIDIMDGRFVPSRSITCEQIIEIPANLQWEVHLMVEQPEKQFAGFKKAGAKKVIFHYEAAPKPGPVISTARKLGLEIGIAVNPETPVVKILPLSKLVDSVLFLSVHPGFYGAQFIPEVLTKIRELRQGQPSLNIAIDGGIKENNIVQVAHSGVSEICVGSAILLQADPGAAYHKLVALTNQN
jgi:ribulose-phosphate 3-epimerase